MNNLEELQARITAAMDRIGAGVESLSSGAGAEIAESLEEERLVNQQLAERIRVLNRKHAEEIEALKTELQNAAKAEDVRAEMETQARAMAQLDGDLQRLRRANEQLRASNAALREANESGVGEPHLINKAMLAELEGLRASRASDVAEAAAILARLEPAVGAAVNVAGEDA